VISIWCSHKRNYSQGEEGMGKKMAKKKKKKASAKPENK